MNTIIIFIVGLLLLATMFTSTLYVFVKNDKDLREMEEAIEKEMRAYSVKKKRSIPVFNVAHHRWDLKFLDDEEVPSEKRK